MSKGLGRFSKVRIYVDFLRMALEREHCGIISVHQRKISVGGCVRRLKTIVEVKTPEEMRNQIIFL